MLSLTQMKWRAVIAKAARTLPKLERELRNTKDDLANHAGKWWEAAGLKRRVSDLRAKIYANKIEAAQAKRWLRRWRSEQVKVALAAKKQASRPTMISPADIIEAAQVPLAFNKQYLAIDKGRKPSVNNAKSWKCRRVRRQFQRHAEHDLLKRPLVEMELDERVYFWGNFGSAHEWCQADEDHFSSLGIDLEAEEEAYRLELKIEDELEEAEMQGVQDWLERFEDPWIDELYAMEHSPTEEELATLAADQSLAESENALAESEMARENWDEEHPEEAVEIYF